MLPKLFRVTDHKWRKLFPADHKIAGRTFFWGSFVEQIAILSQISHVLDPKKFPRTNLRTLADHKWSADRSLGNTGLDENYKIKGKYSTDIHTFRTVPYYKVQRTVPYSCLLVITTANDRKSWNEQQNKLFLWTRYLETLLEMAEWFKKCQQP